MPIDLFISYSHADKQLYELLSKHLMPLQHEEVINHWSDRQIMPGTEFGDEIMAQLNKADVILLLISPDFVASKYCWGIEMKRAMARHETQSARVIPVILRPVDWFKCPFGKLLALPTDGKAVTTWANQDEAFLDVAKSIRITAADLNDSPLRNRVLETATVWIDANLHTRCDIFLDDDFVAEIGESGHVPIRVAPGEHSVQLFGFPRQKSNKLFFRASRNEMIHLEVSVGDTSAIGSMAAGFGVGDMFVLKMRT